MPTPAANSLIVATSGVPRVGGSQSSGINSDLSLIKPKVILANSCMALGVFVVMINVK